MNTHQQRPRLDIFDGLRGHLLIGMLIAHLSFQPGLKWLGNFHHARIIQLYDAEFFVLIAGLLVGYLWTNVYTTSTRRRKFVANRLMTIYRYYLLSALPFFISSTLAGASLIKSILGVAFMQIGGYYSDILPIYFVCFLIIAPFAIFSLLNSPALLLAASAVIYVGSQLTELGGFFGSSGAFVTFDIAAWQFLFVCSILIGKHGIEIYTKIENAEPRFIGITLLVLVVLSLILRQNDFYPNPLNLTETITGNKPRRGLHLLYLIRIFLISAGVAIILIRNDVWIRPIHKILHWYFGLAIIRNVGKYSIQMFVLHVYIMVLYKTSYHDTSDGTKAAFALFWIAVFIALPSLWLLLKPRLLRQ